jgi:D-aminoacyl-tRNA deacylase
VRAVCQRVSRAQVTVAGDTVATIGSGLVVLLGIADGDAAPGAEKMAGKVARLRIFEDGERKFAKSLLDVGGEALVVSQFTLLADTRKGSRPSFTDAARPEVAEPLYERFCSGL